MQNCPIFIWRKKILPWPSLVMSGQLSSSSKRRVFQLIRVELGLLHFVMFPFGISTTDLSEVECHVLHLNNLPALTLSVHHVKQYVRFKCTFLQFHQKTDPWDHFGPALYIWHSLLCLL